MLHGLAARCDPGVLNLAFVFLLVGYGTKAGLVAAAFLAAGCRGRGADRHLGGAVRPAAERRAACGAAGQGDRRRASGCGDTGPFLIAFGLASLLLAAFALWRRRDARRFFAWSSIKQHIGLAALAFGIGGATANLAGLLHMLGHSLTKSAVFFGVGHAAQLKGSQKTADIGGLVASPSGARLGAGARHRRPSPGCRPSRCSPANSCC